MLLGSISILLPHQHLISRLGYLLWYLNGMEDTASYLWQICDSDLAQLFDLHFPQAKYWQL